MSSWSDCLNGSSWNISDRCEQQQQILFGTASPDKLEFPGYIRETATLFCVGILVLGVVGNLLVPVIVSRTKELRNSTNLFLINLSVADLLVLLVCMPSVLIELHSQPEVWTLGAGMCKAIPFVEQTVANGSILTILAISLERYVAICQPLKASYTCTKMREVVIISGLWFTAIFVTCPVLVITEFAYTPYVDGSLVPVCLTMAHSFWQKSYYFLVTGSFFWLPLGVLLVMYGVIAKHLMVDTSGMLHSSSERVQIRSRRQVVQLLAAVVFFFFVCLMPFRIFTTWLILAPQNRVEAIGMETYYNLLYFCRILLYLNSAIDPILYGAISSKFREGFSKLLYWKTVRPVLRKGTTTTTTTSTSCTTYSSLRSKSINVGDVSAAASTANNAVINGKESFV